MRRAAVASALAALVAGSAMWLALGTESWSDDDRVQRDLSPTGYDRVEPWVEGARIVLDDDLWLLQKNGVPRMRCRELETGLPLDRLLGGCVTPVPRTVGHHWVLGISGSEGRLLSVLARGPVDAPEGLDPRVTATHPLPADVVYCGVMHAPSWLTGDGNGLLFLDAQHRVLELVPLRGAPPEPDFAARRVVGHVPAGRLAIGTGVVLELDDTRTYERNWRTRPPAKARLLAYPPKRPSRTYEPPRWQFEWDVDIGGRRFTWLGAHDYSFHWRAPGEEEPAPWLAPLPGDTALYATGTHNPIEGGRVMRDTGPNTPVTRIDVPGTHHRNINTDPYGTFTIALTTPLRRGDRIRLERVESEAGKAATSTRWFTVAESEVRAAASWSGSSIALEGRGLTSRTIVSLDKVGLERLRWAVMDAERFLLLMWSGRHVAAGDATTLWVRGRGMAGPVTRVDVPADEESAR